MSGISKTIEQVKEHKENFERYRSHKGWKAFEVVASSSIMPIITAYEQSQTKIGQMESAILEDYETSLALKTELLAALKPIADAEVAARQPTMNEMRAAMYAYDKHKGE